jgi:hypothetical protein
MRCLLEMSFVALYINKMFIGGILRFALPKCQCLLELEWLCTVTRGIFAFALLLELD